jgi:hypothetical protein
MVSLENRIEDEKFLSGLNTKIKLRNIVLANKGIVKLCRN